MKRVIQGKVYNTDTATLICEVGNGLGASDFDGWYGDLYRSPKGHYFIAGSGGARTMFGEGNGRTIWGTSGIILVDEADAQEMASKALDGDAYIIAIGQVEEG